MYQIFIVNNFIEYYKLPNDKNDLGSIFETDKYLKSVSIDQRDFTSRLTKTQVFNSFIENYYRPLKDMSEEITYFKRLMNVFLQGGMWDLNKAIDDEIFKIMHPSKIEISIKHSKSLYNKELVQMNAQLDKVKSLSCLNHDCIISMDDNFDELMNSVKKDCKPNDEWAVIEVSKLKTQMIPKSKGMMMTTNIAKHAVQKCEINLFDGDENMDE